MLSSSERLLSRTARGSVVAVILAAALLMPALAGAQNMEAWYREGMANLQAGRKAQAQANFLNVLAEVPDHFRSMAGLARLYLDTSPQKALEYANQAIQLAPSYEVAHYIRGQALERMARDDEAAEAYRQVIRLDPRHTDANTRLRNLLRRQQEQRGQVKQASERFWAEPSLRTLTLFGQILLQQAKPDEALVELEAIRRKRPDLPEVNLWIARASRAGGDVDGEQAAYQRFLAVRSSLGVRLIMAERLEAIGRYRSAMDVLAPIEGDPQALTTLDRPDKARLAYLRSRSLITRKQFAAVGDQLVEAGRQGYDPVRLTATFREDLALYDNQAVLWMRFADWYRLRNDTDNAAAAEAQACHTDRAMCPDARKALEAMRGGSKTPPGVLVALGDVALTQGKPAEALGLLQAVQPGEDAYRRAQLLQGLIYRQQGDTTRSVDSLMRYVFLFPDRNGMLYARGTLFWEMGERDVAVAVWKEHPEVLAEHPELLARLALHLQSKNDPAAEVLFREQLAQSQPELAANHVRLGDLYLAQGRKDDALREWQAALKSRPRDADLMVRVARMDLEQGKTDEAAVLLRQAWQLQNIPPDLAVELAQQLVRRREGAQALEVYLQVYREAPTNAAMRQAFPELALTQPTTPEVRRVAADVALDTNRPKLAENLLVQSLMERPADPEAREALASYYRRQGQPDVADRVMRGDFRVSPASPVARNAAQPPAVASVAPPPVQPAPVVAQPRPAPVAMQPAPVAVPTMAGRLPDPRGGEAVIDPPGSYIDRDFLLRRNPNAAPGAEGM